MANVIQYDSFYRGDTPVFAYEFSQPYAGFSWSGVTADYAMTDIEAPDDNTGAAVVRLAQPLTIDGDNNASFQVQPTVVESKALTAGSKYMVQVQLKEGSTNVATPVTGKVKVLQDYII